MASAGLLLGIALLLDLVGYAAVSIGSVTELGDRTDEPTARAVCRRCQAELERDDDEAVCRMLDEGCPNVEGF